MTRTTNSLSKRPLRNLGVIAHVDAGKTTTTERILFYTGESHRIGDVDDGTTRMDFDPQERRRGITINAAATTVHWRDTQLNLIDTPGHIDFHIEVNRSLRVLDGAVVVFDGVAGVEPQTETNWRLADRYGVPRIAFVNKLDRVGADFARVVAMMAERLGTRPVALHLPIGAEGDFRGVVDLVTMQALTWDFDDARHPPRIDAIPDDLRASAELLRARLVETVADQDDAVLEAWLRGDALSPDQLRTCIRRGTLAGAFVPVLAGSAFRNRGVEPLLDAIVDYLPAPEDIVRDASEGEGGDHGHGHAGTPAHDPDGPFAALAFKVVADDHGTLVALRVYRGRLQRGDTVLDTATGRRERVARIYELHADKRVERDEIVAGDIAAVVGFKDTLTGHTLADPAHPVRLEDIRVPEPVIDVAVEPRGREDQQNLTKALHALVREDPSLRMRQDAESGQVILSGMGELQLEVAIENLRSRHGVEVRTGRPRVAYREVLGREIEVEHLHRKQSGGPGQYAQVRLRFEPLARGEGVVFESRVTGGAVPREFIPAVEAGVRAAAANGPVGGFPLVDFRAVLLDGAAHEKDSSALAFELASAHAAREAFAKAEPRLLEPVMAVEVVTPADYLGDVLGDLHRRRGHVRGQQARGDVVTVDAHVPLKEMFGYIGALRALSSGRAQYSMQMDHYDVAPPRVAAEVVPA